LYLVVDDDPIVGDVERRYLEQDGRPGAPGR
jgi:hypothetical protein